MWIGESQHDSQKKTLKEGCLAPLTNKDPEKAPDIPKQGIWQKHCTPIVPFLCALVGVLVTVVIILAVFRFGRDQLCDVKMMEIKKQLCVTTSKVSNGCSLCPNGWLRHRENCYYISSGREYRTWNESRKVCERMGADLLVIEDQEQQDFIRRSSKGQSFQVFWIGLYRDGDGWRWVDSRHYNTSLFNLSGSSGKCTWLEADSGYNKDRCQSKHNWICQKRGLKI